MASYVFVAAKCLDFDAQTLEEKPLGGTETSVIRLTEALAARKHSVQVYTPHPAPRSSAVAYKSIASFREGFSTEVYVAVRDWQPLVARVRSQRRYFWTGDAYDQPATFGIGDQRLANALTGLLCVSAWQAATLSSQSGFPVDKTLVLRNGVHLPYFSGQRARKRKALIYSSTPYRGLALIPKLFQEVKKKHKEAELNIFSGYDVYGGGAGHDLEGFRKLSAELSGIQGVTLHGNVQQKILAQHFMQSSVLFYPNTFPETSCITALEAQAAGCVVLSSKLGAMSETVADCGVLVEGNPQSDAYQNAFVQAADKLLSDDAYWKTLSEKGRKRVEAQYSWDFIAQQFENISAGKN